jgi:putative membrane protein
MTEPGTPVRVDIGPDQMLTTTVEDPEQGWRRLSIRMLLVHPVMELMRFIPVLVLLVVFNRRDQNGFWPLLAVGAFVALGVARWFTTRYRVTPTQVQVRRGLLSKSTLSVPRDRVRSVDMTRHFMHRLLGLTRLTIGTGQSDRQKQDGLQLDALTSGAAEQLRRELLHERPGIDVPRAASVGATTAPVAAAPRETVIARFQPSWVRYAPFTLSGLTIAGAAIGLVVNAARQAQVDILNAGPVTEVRHDLNRLPVVWAAVVIAILLLAIIAILSVVAYVLAAWNFALTRVGGTLHVSRGLVTTRSTTIEERRLRGVEFSEPLLLRAVHGARAVAITTGLRVGRGAERGGSMLMPASPAGDVRAATDAVLRTPEPNAVPLVPHGARARRRRFTRALGVAAVLCAALVALWFWASWPVWVAWLGVAMLPVGALLAADRYRSLGHAYVDGFLVTRQGSVVRRRYMVHGDGIIGWNEHQSFFQRRSGLVTLHATTAAGSQSYEILDVTPQVGLAVADRATPGLLNQFFVTGSS